MILSMENLPSNTKLRYCVALKKMKIQIVMGNPTKLCKSQPLYEYIGLKWRLWA